MLNKVLVVIVFSFIFHFNASAMERIQSLNEQLRHNPLKTGKSPEGILVKQQAIAQGLGELITVGKGCSQKSFQRVCTKEEGLTILAGLVKCVVLKSPEEMRRLLTPSTRPQAPQWQIHIANCREFSDTVRALWTGNTHALWGDTYGQDNFVESQLASLLKSFGITDRQKLIDFIAMQASSGEYGIFKPQFKAKEKQEEIKPQIKGTLKILVMSPEDKKTYREHLFHNIGLATGIEKLNLNGQELYDYPLALTRLSSLTYLGLRNNFLTKLQAQWSLNPDLELEVSGNHIDSKIYVKESGYKPNPDYLNITSRFLRADITKITEENRAAIVKASQQNQGWALVKLAFETKQTWEKKYVKDDGEKKVLLSKAGKYAPALYSRGMLSQGLYALGLIEEACGQDYVDALLELGLYHYKGKKMQTAREYFKRAGDQGGEEAIYYLAELHRENPDGEQDWHFIARCYEYGNRKGHPPSMHRLGYCYEQGLGVTKDLMKAAYCYRFASEETTDPDNIRADIYYDFARLSELGLGGFIDGSTEYMFKSEAKRCYDDARKLGHKKAGVAYDRVCLELSNFY